MSINLYGTRIVYYISNGRAPKHLELVFTFSFLSKLLSDSMEIISGSLKKQKLRIEVLLDGIIEIAVLPLADSY
jgi:hypothetical protein